MDDDVLRCGNDLRYILNLIHHLGGDPRFKNVISDLAALTQATVQVLVSLQITNNALAREFRAESAKALTAAAGKLGFAEAAKAAA